MAIVFMPPSLRSGNHLGCRDLSEADRGTRRSQTTRSQQFILASREPNAIPHQKNDLSSGHLLES